MQKRKKYFGFTMEVKEVHCDKSKNCFRKHLHVIKTMYEFFFNVEESHELQMFQIFYLYLRRYVIK